MEKQVKVRTHKKSIHVHCKNINLAINANTLTHGQAFSLSLALLPLRKHHPYCSVWDSQAQSLEDKTGTEGRLKSNSFQGFMLSPQAYGLLDQTNSTAIVLKKIISPLWSLSKNYLL